MPSSEVAVCALRAVLNGWQLSGIASFINGARAGVGFSQTNPTDITAARNPRIVQFALRFYF